MKKSIRYMMLFVFIVKKLKKKSVEIMKHMYSHTIVIFVGLSFILGSMSGEFSNNQGILTGAAISATFFAFFDLANETEKKESKLNNILKQIFLLLGIFSIIVLPHISFLVNLFNDKINSLTLVTLGIVISLMGFRHMKFEGDVWRKLLNNYNDMDKIVKKIEDKLDDEKNEN